jgi:hypothetical protein
MRSVLLLICSALVAAKLVSATATDAVQPWNGAALSDWTNADKAVFITDMTAAEPSSAFSPTPKKGHWMVIPYEMRPDTGGHKGKAVWCGYEADPPEITIRLGTKGWHAIFVGIPCGAGLWLKLDQDKAPLWRNNGVYDYYVNSVDTFFKVAELNDNSKLIFRPQRHGNKMPASITHIMLVPLTEAEIERLKKDRADTSHRTMAATYDGFSPICGRSPRTEEEVLAEVEEYRDSDFGTFIVHGAWSGDKTFYPSKVGYMPGGELEDVCADYHRAFIESTQELARKNINPLKVMIDGAHDAGMKVHVGIRPAGWSYYQPYNGLWDSPFYLNNPQWRCIDRADRGAPETTRMSWAVPEVRRHIIDLLAEQVAFGADGAHIVFNRGYPLVLYEKPFCDMFIEKHGMDPNQIAEEDPRVIQMRSDIVSTFFKELRAELDKEEQRRADGRHIEISAMVLGNNENNLQYGVDVSRLVREKLLDVVYIYQFDFGATKGGGYDPEYFREACGSQGVPHLPTVDPPYDLKGQLPQALQLYESGAPGITFWDAGGVDTYKWAIQSRLGHIDEVRWRHENLDSEKPPRNFHFYKRWGAQRMDGRFPVYWGG